MATQKDPELTSSYSHTESTPTYRALPPKEDLRADQTVTTYRRTI